MWAGSNKALFLSAFEIFPEDYLEILLAVSEMPYFKESFDIAFEGNPDFWNHTLEEMVFLAMELPHEKQLELYYRLLIEPIAILTVFDREENEE